jgi:UDP-N-acetylmuramyl-tripeptide synthetase
MNLYGISGIKDIVYDSRKAESGMLFVCLRGAVTDGHKYAKSAYEKGCRIFLCEEKLSLPEDSIQIIKKDTRLELAKISAEFFDYPAKKLKIIGVTGTKGKTSVELYIYNSLLRAGKKAGLISTNGIFFDDEHILTANSTPESYELHKTFDTMLKHDCEYVVVEVSSQAYKTNRVYGLEFDIGIYTNLSEDHIGEGEHADFDEYKSCKTQLFKNSKVSLINIDDDYADEMIANSNGNVVTYAVKNNKSDYTASNIELWRESNSFGIRYILNNSVDVIINSPGIFNIYNSLATISACDILSIDAKCVLDTLRNVSLSGRFEIVDALPYATFVIDYAHNELSMRNVLETIRTYNPKRIVCLFGSVGGRTQLRRGGLGRIAGELADFCVITSDNPDYEKPLNIMYDIERGLKTNENPCDYIMIADRAEAIKYAVDNAQDGDVVLLTGKGHEDYQLIEGVKVPFCERDLIIQAAQTILSYR